MGELSSVFLDIKYDSGYSELMVYLNRSDYFSNGLDLRKLKSVIERVQLNPIEDKKPTKVNSYNIKFIYKFNTTKQLSISNFLFSEISSSQNEFAS